jgi:hypothetical protein
MLIMFCDIRNEFCYHEEGMCDPASTTAAGPSLTDFKGLMDAEERHGFSDGEGFSYLKNPIWWAGIISCTAS